MFDKMAGAFLRGAGLILVTTRMSASTIPAARARLCNHIRICEYPALERSRSAEFGL